VVTDLKGNIIFVHGDTGKYLRPAPGQATLNGGGHGARWACNWNYVHLDSAVQGKSTGESGNIGQSGRAIPAP